MSKGSLILPGHSFSLARKNTKEVTCLISYCSHVLKTHLLLSCTHTHSKDDSQSRLTMNFFLGFRKDAKIRGSSMNKPQVFHGVLKVTTRWRTNTIERKVLRPRGPTPSLLLMAWFSTYKQENAMETFVFLFKWRRRARDGGGTKPPSTVCCALPLSYNWTL